MLRVEPYDLVLLDMEMPELDGFGVLEQMVADSKLRDIPVIVTSSLEGVANVVRCLELGADDYLHKPMHPALLKARINSGLEKKRLRDQQKEMVRRFATSEVADDLQESGFTLGGRRLRCTVMFSDIRGFTSLVEHQSPEETIELLNAYYALMFDAISGHGGVVNQMVGDGLMATSDDGVYECGCHLHGGEGVRPGNANPGAPEPGQDDRAPASGLVHQRGVD